jgi:nucleoside-diphosphate-sugar epimerase
MNYDIVITGSEGYIGTVIKLELKDWLKDKTVLTIDKIGTPSNTHIQSCISSVKGIQGKVLIHLAAYTSVVESEIKSDDYYTNNVICYNKFLNSNNNQFDHVVYASSYAIYNNLTQIDPSSVYGSTKLEGEFITNRYTDKKTILRFANPFGVYSEHNLDNLIHGEPNVFLRLALCAKEGITFPIHQSKEMVRDFFPVKFIPLMVKKCIDENIYSTANLGSGKPILVNELLLDLCETHKIKSTHITLPKGVVSGIPFDIGSLTKLCLRDELACYDPNSYIRQGFVNYLNLCSQTRFLY